jgi:TolB protein
MPAWSPDNQQFAFVSQGDSAVTEIYVMNADGSNPRRVTFNDRYDFYPVWLP